MSQDSRMVYEALLFFSGNKFQIVKLPKYDCKKEQPSAIYRRLSQEFTGNILPCTFGWTFHRRSSSGPPSGPWLGRTMPSLSCVREAFGNKGKADILSKASAQHQAINCDPTMFHNNPYSLEEEEMKLSGKFFGERDIKWFCRSKIQEFQENEPSRSVTL